MSGWAGVVIESDCVERTLEVGRALGAGLRSGDVVGLSGPLGAGKTVLVKGIAAGLGVDDLRKVTSPTFVLVNEYEGRLHLFHVDAYRLSRAGELEALGFSQMCESWGSAVVLEWADRVVAALPERWLEVRFELIGPTARRLRCCSVGGGCEHLLDRLDKFRVQT